jgi:hypothetical protein
MVKSLIWSNGQEDILPQWFADSYLWRVGLKVVFLLKTVREPQF